MRFSGCFTVFILDYNCVLKTKIWWRWWWCWCGWWWWSSS